MTGGIYIALGANLPSSFGEPRVTLEAALDMLANEGVAVLKRSSWWRSSPQPAADQPDFINGVVEVDSKLPPISLLQALHRIETICGRVRHQRWEARVLDLDLLDYRGTTLDGAAGVSLPHPRLQNRLFVLLPLQEIAPVWRHPVTGEGVARLVEIAEPMKINRL
jgi:2-amino-4-hydroxy-6-hydroxymethyldihydropteridine diphosphokinase